MLHLATIRSRWSGSVPIVAVTVSMNNFISAHQSHRFYSFSKSEKWAHQFRFDFGFGGGKSIAGEAGSKFEGVFSCIFMVVG